MITALFTSGRAPTLLLGLSRDNCRRLLAGQPIVQDLTGKGMPVKLFIVGGESDAALYGQLQQHPAFGGQRPNTCCERHAAEAGVPHNPLPGAGAVACAEDESLPDV